MPFAPQVEIVERYVEDAKARGARVLVGGSRGSARPGYWFEPTVLVGVTNDMACIQEETFGPDAGAVCVNDALVNYTALELPMGGARPGSGIGYRHGAGGIRKYCRQQALLTSRWHPHRDIHMFPYSRRRSRLLTKCLQLLYGRRR